MQKLNTRLDVSDLKIQELFNSVDFETVMPLLSDCDIYNVKKDELLIRATEKNNNIFLILSGSFNVLLAPDSTDPVATLKPGQSIGEIAVIDHQPASAFVKGCKTKVPSFDREILLRRNTKRIENFGWQF